MVHLKDHLELLFFFGGGLVTVLGLSALLFYFEKYEWVAPLIVVGALALVTMEGAYAEWGDAVAAASRFTAGKPLEVFASDVDSRGGVAFLRLNVRNPNSYAVRECYGRVISFAAAGGHPDYPGPPGGYHYPWSTYGGASTLASIAGGSDDYLDVAFAQGQEASKCATPYLNESTQKIEPRHAFLRGEHSLLLEVGSKLDNVPLRRYRVRVVFGGGLDLKADSIEVVELTV